MSDISENINRQTSKAEEMAQKLLAVINTICPDINDIYCVDRRTETVTAIRQKGKAVGLDGNIGMKFGYDMAATAYIRNNVWVGDREAMQSFMKLSNICRRLRDKESVSITYRAKSWMGDRARSLSMAYGIVKAKEAPDMSVQEMIAKADRRRLEYKKVLA